MSMNLDHFKSTPPYQGFVVSRKICMLQVEVKDMKMNAPMRLEYYVLQSLFSSNKSQAHIYMVKFTRLRSIFNEQWHEPENVSWNFGRGTCE